jgi:hypothetical protein
MSNLGLLAATPHISIGLLLHPKFSQLLLALDSRITVPKSYGPIRRSMSEIRKSMEASMIQYLHKLRNRISCTFDIWCVSSLLLYLLTYCICRSDFMSRNSYLAVTAHFVDNDGELQQMLLAIDPIQSSSAVTIRHMIREVFNRWEIMDNHIFRVVSDAHSSNICAFKNDYKSNTHVLFPLSFHNIFNISVLEIIENTDDSVNDVDQVIDIELEARIQHWMENSQMGGGAAGGPVGTATHGRHKRRNVQFDQVSDFYDDDEEFDEQSELIFLHTLLSPI